MNSGRKARTPRVAIAYFGEANDHTCIMATRGHEAKQEKDVNEVI